jgi:flap endonuclease-1
MTQEQFVDLCILCGCDYTANIQGVGPIKAFKYIQEESTIENVVARIEKENEDPKKKKKYHIPESFYYKEARELFLNPPAEIDKSKVEPLIKWDKPNEE